MAHHYNMDQPVGPLADAMRLHAAGRLAEAEDACIKALDESPREAQAMVIMGIIHLKKGQVAEACEWLERAMNEDPDTPFAAHWLVEALRRAGRHDAAVALAQAGINRHPNDPRGYDNLALCLLDAGEATEAERMLRRALQIAPQVAMLHEHLGRAVQALGRHDEAIEEFRTALNTAPGVPNLHYLLGESMLAKEDPTEALACAERCLEIAPNLLSAHLLAARALIVLSRSEEAEKHIEAVLAQEPDSLAATILQATTLQTAGRVEEADLVFRKVIELDPSQSYPYFGLAQNGLSIEDDEPTVKQMERLADEYAGAPERTMLLHYGLGMCFERAGRCEQAMSHFDLANAAAYRNVEERGGFDQKAARHRHQRTIDTVGLEFLEANRARGMESEMPVFVVGMPRSGTSLLEQILSCHSQIGGAGELGRVPNEVIGSGGKGPDFGLLARTAREIVEELGRVAPGKSKVVEKNPTNFAMLGLLHTALPGAKIVHMRREPLDTCISIWTTPFGNVLDFAHDRGNIVFEYREYLRLMEHWRKVLPTGTMLEVDYENLVSSPRDVIGRILEFLGFEWEEACLHPELNPRVVVTPSALQVRKPIGTGSIGRWKRYEPWVGTFEELAE